MEGIGGVNVDVVVVRVGIRFVFVYVLFIRFFGLFWFVDIFFYIVICCWIMFIFVRGFIVFFIEKFVIGYIMKGK